MVRRLKKVGATSPTKVTISHLDLRQLLDLQTTSWREGLIPRRKDHERPWQEYVTILPDFSQLLALSYYILEWLLLDKQRTGASNHFGRELPERAPGWLGKHTCPEWEPLMRIHVKILIFIYLVYPSFCLKLTCHWPLFFGPKVHNHQIEPLVLHKLLYILILGQLSF